MTSLPEGASEIPDRQEDLLRQVHPTQIQEVDGRPASSAFSPRPSDAGVMSTRRAWVGADIAHSQWLAAGRESAGTWGIRQVDFVEELFAYDDSHLPGAPEGHASIDFQQLSKNQQKRVGRQLRDASCDRGCMFSPAA